MAAFNNDLVIRYLDTMAVKDDGCEVVFKAGMTVEVRIYSGCSYAGKLSSNRRYRETASLWDGCSGCVNRSWIVDKEEIVYSVSS